MLIFVCLSIVGYLYPASTLGNIIRYYNGISSLVLIILTLAYVITTNRQLFTMQKQLDIMDSSIKLQIQPLPVPSVKSIGLEKIGAFLGPQTNFATVHLLSRFNFYVDFKNAGTGVALNITAFASISIKGNNEEVREIEIPQVPPNQIHLICENESVSNSMMNVFVILDNQFEIFKALYKQRRVMNQNKVILKLRIYYKNIFGSGFLEEAQYALFFESGQDEVVESWNEFIENGLKVLQQDIIRFESLIHKLPEEAKESFEKVRVHLRERFDKDIKLDYWARSTSFSVKIVDFEKSLEAETSHYKDLIMTYYPDTYKMLED
jgi:hypothetical protein